MSFPHPDSLYTLVTTDAAVPTDQKTAEESSRLHAQLSFFQKHRKPGSLTKPYDKVGINTADLVSRIFTENEACQQKRRKIFGDLSRTQFDDLFGKGREQFRTRMTADQVLMKLFAMKSFPETYFYPEIARALSATGVLTNPDTVAERLMATAGVIFGMIDAEKSLAMMLGMAESHFRKRPKNLYTADTVEFTLLTFSYYGAKPSKIRDAEWFFFWKICGSMMGLPPDHLHDSYEQAKARMRSLHGNCPSQLNADSKKLLEVFAEAFLDDEKSIRDATLSGFVSKRMQQYLEAEKRWPLGLARPATD